jgi:hypothetical protein
MTDDSGSTTNKPGRPQKYADSAARQKAYRARMKDAGFREVKKMIRDVRDIDRKLVSDIIDLSKVTHRKQ